MSTSVTDPRLPVSAVVPPPPTITPVAPPPPVAPTTIVPAHETEHEHPKYRALRVYAFDPSRGRSLGNYMTIRVKWESLGKGFKGDQLHVIDYDATNRRYYKEAKLNSVSALIEGGYEPSEADQIGKAGGKASRASSFTSSTTTRRTAATTRKQSSTRCPRSSKAAMSRAKPIRAFISRWSTPLRCRRSEFSKKRWAATSATTSTTTRAACSACFRTR